MSFLRRFTLKAINTETPSQQAQIETMADQLHSEVEVVESYGITACPPDEVNIGVSGHIGGKSDHGMILGFIDKIFRPKNLKRGEVVVYTKWGGKIELFEDSITITHKKDNKTTTVKLSNGEIVDIFCKTFNLVAENVNITGTTTVTGATTVTGTLSNNGVNVGSTHTHSGVIAGLDNSGVPQ